MSNDNKNLLLAKEEQNGEFFILSNGVKIEMDNYTKFLKGKKVYIPNTKLTTELAQCDAFARYFFSSSTLEKFGIKELSYSFYDNGNFVLITMSNGKITKEVIDASDDDTRLFYVFKQIDKVDVVIGNPEGSKIVDMLRYIILSNKDFILCATNLAIGSKVGYMAYKMNKLKFGFTIPTKFFSVTENKNKTFGNKVWITSFDNGVKPNFISTFYDTQSYSYKMLDNYDALNVECIKMIPMDYKGVMCLPVTVANLISREQFEIIGCLSSSGYDKNIVGIEKKTIGADARAVVDGKVLYARLLIRFRNI